MFQSSFELTGYITEPHALMQDALTGFQSSFELTGYITKILYHIIFLSFVSKLFRAYRLYNDFNNGISVEIPSFKALSSLQVI